MALDAGDLDANYFQHQPYLDEFNAEKKTELASAAVIHYEPFGIYAGKTASDGTNRYIWAGVPHVPEMIMEM